MSDRVSLLEAILKDPGKIVKRSSVTTVTRHRVAERIFYVKRYLHYLRPWRPFVFFFKPSRSKIEWQLSTQLQALGIAVVPHRAHGERWSGRGLLESVLITEGLAGYEPVSDLFAVEAHRLQQSLGRFLCKMHDAGVFHLDLNPENLLYSSVTDSVCLVDLDKISVLPRLSDPQRLGNLTTLRSYLMLSNAFYQAYGHEILQRADEIAQRAQRERRVRWAGWARRWQSHTEDVPTHPIGERAWRVRQPFLTEALREILENPDEFLEKRATILRRTDQQLVGSREGWIVWRFEESCLGSHQAVQWYQNAWHLELAGIATARPIAMAETSQGIFQRRSYFIAQERAGAVALDQCVRDRSELLARVAEQNAKLEAEGFTHSRGNPQSYHFDAHGAPMLWDLEGLSEFVP
jgi:hypothetical protein